MSTPTTNPLPQMMQAAVVDGYGDTSKLTLSQIAVPAIGENEVLVKVCAATVCRGDAYLLSGKPYLIRVSGYGLLRPKNPIPGQIFSGVIVAIGAAVSSYRVGDHVFGDTPSGAFAEYVAANIDLIALKPSSLSHSEAAAVASGTTALQSLRDTGRVTCGQHVLINGASGSVGSMAVQIAKALGAHVTAVCSPRHEARLKTLGADEIIDYTHSDFTQSQQQFDVIIDLVANRALADYKRVMKQDSRYVGVSLAMNDNWLGPITGLLRIAITNCYSSNQFLTFFAKPNHSDFTYLAQLADNNQVKAVIEHRYPLSNLAQAIAHVASGHAQGTTIIEIDVSN